jgi:1,4-alpha-glucan branching enzyme
MLNPMKENQTNIKPASEPRIKPVHIEFSHPTAEEVRIAGSFNDWRPEATPMIALGGGRWAKKLVLPPGKYEYCLVVDGYYLPDPQSRQTSPNPFGGVNSVMSVEAQARTRAPERPVEEQTDVNESEQANSNYVRILIVDDTPC